MFLMLGVIGDLRDVPFVGSGMVFTTLLFTECDDT